MTNSAPPPPLPEQDGIVQATENGGFWVAPCNDPADPAQVRQLKRSLEQGFSSLVLGGAVDGRRTETSRQSRGWQAAAFRSHGEGGEDVCFRDASKKGPAQEPVLFPGET